MNNNCSPNNIYNQTCLTFPALIRVGKKLNLNVSKYNIKNRSKLIKDIKYAFKKRNDCNHNIDICILKNKSTFDKYILDSFKPLRPKGKNTWLSTIDINDVMKQYEKKYTNFIFMGAVPIDFDYIYDEFSNINLKQLCKLKKKIGFVFNTDPSYESGEHWISMFLDLCDNTLCFYDSVGTFPPYQISNFIKRLINQANDINIKLNLYINSIEHQTGNNECGVYSLYFLISRLEGKTCNDIFNNKINDKEMNKYRKKFFSSITY